MLQFLTETAPDASASMWSTLIMLVVMGGLLYFMMIRPENKRKKESEQMREGIKTHDKVTTIGGIVGTVVDVKDDKVVIETGADQVRLELMKWGISTNDSADERRRAEAKKAQEARAKAKAVKKAQN